MRGRGEFDLDVALLSGLHALRQLEVQRVALSKASVDQAKSALDGELTELVKGAKQKYFMQLAVQGYPSGGMNIYLSA